MERKVQKINVPVPEKLKLKRVAAYARVSSSKDAMHHSISAQISYYNNYIQSRRDWTFAGVFTDEGVSGASVDRDGFNAMVTECRKGNIDMIITKSISRFARNTIVFLQTIRELADLGVEVYFEEQRLSTASADGELLLTLLGSFAQAESQSCSENQKWRIKKNFEEGIPWNGAMLGYRQKDKKYVIVPEEAEVVKRIFREYLEGYGVEAITKHLNDDGVLTRRLFTWHTGSVTRILRNYNYTGNLLLQRFYNENYITKKKCKNNGEHNMYHAADTHEAIIPLEVFNQVQDELKRRADKFTGKSLAKPTYDFTRLITCEKCGKKYRRKTTKTRVVWICTTYNSQGKSACSSKAIPEEVLYDLTEDISLDALQEIMEMDCLMAMSNIHRHKIVT